MRVCLLLIVMMILAGCSSTEQAAPTAGENQLIEATNDSVVEGFLQEFRTTLEKRNWEAFRKLHWSGSEQTAESLEQFFGPKLEKMGPASGCAVRRHLIYDQDSYEDYIDREEIPGPPELLRGSIEFSIQGTKESSPGLNIWAYLAEEDGQVKIFDYLEVWTE
ncbi:MAG: hypothetical protein KDA65_15660 [Planctomycetaceae bacterium]|nr:hypothetical protein [Planctomycetaceae bacterium]